jgi:phosphatidylglycerol:prolipoprotein diacylglycerol transferase
MLPVLLDLKFIKIYTFGVFLVLAFFWSTYLLWRNVSLTSYKEEDVFDGLFISLFGGMLIGRLLYVALHFDKFGFNASKFILINGYPGLSLVGILVGGFISFLIFAAIKKIKFSEIIDYAIPPLFIALAIGKLGSFFSGVEVGSKTKFPLALKYTNFDGLRHLTALYEAILFFIAAFVAYKLLFAIRRNQYSRGLGFFLFGWAFSLVYFIMDPLKTGKVMVLGHSANWFVSLALLLTFSVYLLYHFRTQLLGRVAKVTNSIKHNARTKSNIHRKTTEEVRGGADEDSATDSET